MTTQSPRPSSAPTGGLDAARADAFLADFATMSAFGATASGGVDRQAASPADVEQRALAAVAARAAGPARRVRPHRQPVRPARARARRPVRRRRARTWTRQPHRRPLRRRLRRARRGARGAPARRQGCGDSGEPPGYNLAVVNWFNEEGSRFMPSMMGSSVYTGRCRSRRRSPPPITTGVRSAGARARSASSATDSGPVAAYCAEIHIEQGRSWRTPAPPSAWSTPPGRPASTRSWSTASSPTPAPP